MLNTKIVPVKALIITSILRKSHKQPPLVRNHDHYLGWCLDSFLLLFTLCTVWIFCSLNVLFNHHSENTINFQWHLETTYNLVIASNPTMRWIPLILDCTDGSLYCLNLWIQSTLFTIDTFRTTSKCPSPFKSNVRLTEIKKVEQRKSFSNSKCPVNQLVSIL